VSVTFSGSLANAAMFPPLGMSYGIVWPAIPESDPEWGIAGQVELPIYHYSFRDNCTYEVVPTDEAVERFEERVKAWIKERRIEEKVPNSQGQR
jgi:hypothetical protein